MSIMSGWTDTVPRWLLIVAAWIVYVGALAVLTVMAIRDPGSYANPSAWVNATLGVGLFGAIPAVSWTWCVNTEHLGYVSPEWKQRKARRVERRQSQRATRAEYRRLKEAGIPIDKPLGYGQFSIRLSPQEARDRAIAERQREIAAINRQLDDLGVEY